MSEITAGLIFLGVLLAIVTVVGHGIWVVLAALFRIGRPRRAVDASAARGSTASWSCPRCGSHGAPGEGRCAVCGWPDVPGRPSRRAALRTVREQVERLARLGLVDAESCAALVAAVATEERRLAEAEALAEPVAHGILAEPAAPSGSGVAAHRPGISAAESASPAVPSAPVSPVELVGARARKYAASREAAAEALAEPVAHELAEPVAPGASVARASEPVTARAPISRLLAAFMEEKNIRWGELVGGLLIVGCSIALVISFWSQIAERPLVKFVLLGGVTAALFVVGFYTDRRWRIHTTSHGLLVIATLLVPLNFLAIAAFTQHTPPTDVVALGGEAAFLALFTTLIVLAGQVLVPAEAWLLAAGVMIPSLLQLLIRRFAEPATAVSGLYLLAALPVGTYLVTTSLAARRGVGRCAEGSLSETAARGALTFLALVTFATILPVALLTYRVPPPGATLHRLAPVVAASGLPALMYGLLLWRGIRERRLTGLQTGGLAIGVLGALVMLAAIVLAWPEPAAVVPTALVTAALLTATAVGFEMPAAHVAAQLAVLLAIVSAVTGGVESRDWYTSAAHRWLEPWFLEAQGIALAGYCMVMSALPRRRSAAGRRAPLTIVAEVTSVALVFLLVGLALYAVVAGAAQELEPLTAARGSGSAVRVVTPIESFEVARIPHAHAAGRGAWGFAAAVAVALTAGWWRDRAEWRWRGLLVAGAAACLLLAARWEPEVAVASALRWLTAGFFALCSVAIWLRGGRRRGAGGAVGGMRPAADVVIGFCLVLVVLVYVMMGAYVFQAALSREGLPDGTSVLWWWLAGWAVIAALTAASIRPAAAGGGPPSAATSWAAHSRGLLLVLGGAPLAILVSFAVARALDQHPIVGPEQTSWFRRIGWDVSYGVPLGVIGLVLVGHAIRDRSSGFAFAAGLLANVVATIVLLMRLARGGGALDAAAWVVVAQVNAVVAGVVAVVWLAAVEWFGRRAAQAEPMAHELAEPVAHELAGPVAHELAEPVAHRALAERVGRVRPLLLVTQGALAAALCGTFLIPAAARLAVEWTPLAALPGWVAEAGSPLGWCAVVLTALVGIGLHRWRAWHPWSVAIALAALVSMIALTVLRLGQGDLPAYHTLLAGCCAAAWLLPSATRGVNRFAVGVNAATPTHSWSALPARMFDAAGVWLALWEYSGSASWWVIGGLVAIAARNVVAGWREGGRGALWIAAPLLVIATSSWWLDFYVPSTRAAAGARPGVAGATEFFGLFWVNVVAVALAAVASVAVERRHLARSIGDGRRPSGIAFHRFAAWAITAVLVLTTGIGLIADLLGEPIALNLSLGWAAWSAAVVTAVACLWDPAVRWPVACLYCVGLVGVGLFLDGLNLQAPLFHWALALALSAYSLATSTLWSGRGRLRELAERLGVPIAEGAERRAAGGAWFEAEGHGWLVPMNFLLGVAVLMLVWWIELTTESFHQRMVAAYAVGAQAFALGLLARGAVRTPLQYLALVWGGLFTVAFAWAWLPPHLPWPGTTRVAEWLDRLAVSIAALAVTVVVYGFGLVKLLRRENEWTRAAGRLVPTLAVVTALVILSVLAIEVGAYLEQGQVPIRPFALVTVGVALAVLASAAVVAALVPGRDPLGLSERGRTLYVYAAESLVGLLFLHIRVTMPWLFGGWFLRLWPLVVMAIAFVGVGLGEVFRRRQQRVLWEPLENTGALLPLLPALGFWAVASEVHYSLLLLSIGVLYGGLSVLRKSFGYAVLAALAANGSLWYVLHRGEGLGLLEHPQLWLIPPALSLLAAGSINRRRLTAQQAAAIRYASAIVIYVSSTADVFIHGVAEAPWLPAVLAGLSILGVLAGIVLRVRAFLYLGTAFLVVALLTIIWHAAIHQQRTWILWVAGIVTGMLLLGVFGLFEKRREDVLRVVEQLKSWEA